MRLTPILVLALLCAPQVFATSLEVIYLRIAQADRPTLSNLDPIPDDLGLAGAKLGVSDNNSTGRFQGYSFALETLDFSEGEVEPAIAQLAQSPQRFVLLDMQAEQMLTIIDELPDRIYFNVRSYDNALRNESCRATLLHSLPSYAMRADALMQFLIKKKWDKLALVYGSAPEDQAFAEALRQAAKKFGQELAIDQPWLFDADMRRNAAAEVPLFTQKMGEFDVLLVADEFNDFARYLPYHTWLPRPIMGGDGLRSRAWSSVIEQWGAAQLQSRFRKLAERDMQSVDYAAWAALRTLDEAFIRSKSSDPAGLLAYALSEEFALAGFKGRPLSYRDWNGQMRQPIALVTASAAVAQAPLEGFLHATNELDSLGLDRPQAVCQAFTE